MKYNLLQVVLDLQFVGEKVVAALAREVSGEYNVFFCCLDRVGLLGEELQKEGFFVKALDRRPGRDWTIPSKIARLTKDLNIDIIHAHHYTPYFYSALSRLIHRHPRLLFTEHGRNLPDIVNLDRKLTNLVLNFVTNRITSVCDSSKRALQEKDWLPSSKISVIYNGIEPVEQRIASVDENTQKVLDWLGPTDFAVGFLARLDPIKDPILMLESFRIALQEVPKAKLIVMGKGPLHEELVQRCQSYGISRNVMFSGLLKNPMPVLPRLRTLVMTSLSEAASLSILEAMMCGIPVIAKSVGGNPELITDQKTGFLIADSSAPSFAEAMVKVLKDESLSEKMGQAAKKEANDRFSLKVMVEQYKSIYRNLLNHNPSRNL
jgi:glycosyltransferase involved in cell wall biosynthesis